MNYTTVSKAELVFLSANVSKISLQEALDRKFFGPVYHGTSETAFQEIKDKGFKVFIGHERTENVKHGYDITNYFNDIAAPIHHLGFGIYFTTVKAIAKQFNYNSTKNLKTYYLDVTRLETINFGSAKNMMKWWNNNGYNPTPALYDKEERLQQTINLTKNLEAQYDAVWFKGKGIRRLLDGDQICVFNPNNIYEIDPKLAKPFEIGSRVRRKEDGMVGVIVRKEDITGLIDKVDEFPGIKTWVKPGAKFRFTVKWKSGTDYNVLDIDVEPFIKGERKK